MTTYQELKQKLINYAYEHKIPLSGEFEIISQCNFNCPMCYAKNQEPTLKKDDWIRLFDMAHSHGMLYTLLTGGEIFLNPDFIEIYNHLYDLGVKITLYTNGSIMNDELLNALKKRPPEMVAITLYGYDKESYQAFTQTDKFERVDKTINLLIENNINLVFRTIPLPLIYENLDQMIDYAKSKNRHLGYFLYVSKVKGQDRLSPKELLDFEIRMKEAFPINKTNKHKERCGAFKNGFFINHKGYMQACPMMPIPTEKVKEDFMKVFLNLQEKWEDMLKESPCSDCELNQSCMTCLARRYLEGNIFKCSSYLKDIALEKNHD
jgi:radical SAM protein with 4Fe4S-binding SPASM domain